MSAPAARAACRSCGQAALSDPGVERQPCRNCGSLTRLFVVSATDTLTVDHYVVTKFIPVDADRSLPEKGVVRSYNGTRRGRDGGRVHRDAGYDPYRDVATERVVDAETGEVIVDKTESMKAKYSAEGRWSPEDSTRSS